MVLEITELSDEQDFPGLAEQVKRLRDMGFDAAIDDAGAGASGLNRIMIIRPTWIKLDREFVRGIDTDRYKQNLVRFFVHFARLSGVSVIAEGIEHKSELAMVIDLGVRYAQGYYLGHPGPREQTTDPRFVSSVRGRWAEVDAEAAPANDSATLAKLCRPVLTLEADSTVAHAAAACGPTRRSRARWCATAVESADGSRGSRCWIAPVKPRDADRRLGDRGTYQLRRARRAGSAGTGVPAR